MRYHLFIAALRSDRSAAFALGSLNNPKQWRAGLLRLINFLITEYLDDPRYGVSPICNVRTCAFTRAREIHIRI